MTHPRAENRQSDSRWTHGMNGWRVVLVMGNAGEPHLGFGEVTGFEDGYVFVVLDGEEDPRKVFWTIVRPA